MKLAGSLWELIDDAQYRLPVGIAGGVDELEVRFSWAHGSWVLSCSLQACASLAATLYQLCT